MVIINSIVQLLIGAVLGEILGQIIFYRFKYGWKIILSFCLTSFVILVMLILVFQIIRETATGFFLSQAAAGTIGAGFIGWTFFRMQQRAAASSKKDQSDRPPLASTLASKQSTRSPEIRRESPNDGGREAYGEASSDMKDLTDDELYALAWQELEEQTFDKGLWARLFAENSGDENKTKAVYVKDRVEALQSQRKHQQALDNEQRALDDAEEKLLMTKLCENHTGSHAEINRFKSRESRLMAAINSRSVSDVLKCLAGGVDPRLPDVWYHRTAREMLTDQIQAAKRATGSERYQVDQELLSIITVSERLWEKGILTKTGVAPKK